MALCLRAEMFTVFAICACLDYKSFPHTKHQWLYHMVQVDQYTKLYLCLYLAGNTHVYMYMQLHSLHVCIVPTYNRPVETLTLASHT